MTCFLPWRILFVLSGRLTCCWSVIKCLLKTSWIDHQQMWNYLDAGPIVSKKIVGSIRKWPSFYCSFTMIFFVEKITKSFSFHLGTPTSLPQRGSVRFILGFYWLFCIVLVATYSGNIISFLAVDKATVPFNNLVELLNLDNYIVSIHCGYQTFFEVFRCYIADFIWLGF